MEVKELRVGNYLLIPTLKDYTVLSNNFKQVVEIANYGDIAFYSEDDDNLYRYHQMYCDGVPLTKEWLVRFSLPVHKSFDELFVLNNNFVVDSKTFEVFLDKKIAGEFISINTIKYVHQLQNLYFALTGKDDLQ